MMEIGVARTYPRDPVLAHQDGDVRIMHEIAGEIRQLDQDLRGNVGVAMARDEDTIARRGEQRR